MKTRARAVDGVFEGRAQRVEHIDADTLVRRGATTLGEALVWLNGASDTSPTGTTRGAMIDGLPASQVRILRDGMPLVDPSGSPQGPLVDLATLPIDPSAIRRIDVYRGVGPSGSGGASGVVIDIITRRGRRRAEAFGRAKLLTASQSLDAQSYAAGASGPIARRWHLRGLAQYSDSAALDVDLDGDPELAARRHGHAELTLAHRRGSTRWRLQLVGQTGRITSPGGATAALDDLVRRHNVRARLHGRWWAGRDARVEHRLDVGYQAHTLHKLVRASGFERLKADTRQPAASSSTTTTWFLDEHELVAEVSGRARHVTRTGESGALAPVTLASAGVGIADTWRPAAQVELFGRVFGEAASTYGGSLQGQLDAAWRLGSMATLRTSAAQTRRLPGPEELFLSFDHAEVGYRVQGNPALRPERLRSLSLGIVFTGEARRWGVEARAYNHWLDDMIVTTATPDDPSLFTYANQARAHLVGAQLQARLERLPGGLAVMAQYTAQPIARDRDTGARLTMRAAHAARAELRGTWLGGRLEAWHDLSTRAAFDVPTGSPPANAQLLLGAGIGWRWRHARVLLDLNNLLDIRDATWGPAGRQGFLVVELRR